MSGQVETTKDIGTDPAALATRWIRELALSETHERKWRERSLKIVNKYRDEAEAANDKPQSEYNILYANVEVLKGVMYQKTPSADVRRRYRSADPVGREAAEVLKQALTYTIDTYDFDGLMRSVVEDVLLPGRGVARVRYIPTMEKADDGSESVAYEEAKCEYVEWEMFRYSPAKRWSKVRWVAFGELMTRDDLVKRFGDKGQACTLNWMPAGMDKDSSENDIFKRALVWMIWDKTTRQVFAICDGYTEAPLDVAKDPLKLEGFFPMPEPVYGIRTNNSLIPVPEYITYQNQALELDEISKRITLLTAELKRRGVYDATYPELEKLARAGDNDFIAIEKFVQFSDKGGLDKALIEAPIELLSKVILGLYEQREQIKTIIYEITGISDIVRGATKASETLGAQQLKAKYNDVRTGPRQAAIARFARDILRLKAEIISEHFSPQTLSLMVGKTIDPQVLQLLKNDKLRGFRIDIETDSTIEPDASEEQQNRVQLLTAISSFMQQAIPAVQIGAIPVDVVKQLLMFGVRAFKVGPDVEEIFDQWQMQQQPPGTGPQAQQQLQMQQQQLQEQQAQLQQAGQQMDQKQQQLAQEESALNDQQARMKMDQLKLAYDQKVFAMDQQVKQFITQQQEQAKAGQEKAKADAHAEVEGKESEKDALLQGLAQSQQMMMDLLGKMLQSQDALLQGQQQIAAIASADRVSTLSRGKNGEKTAVSKVVMQ